ncbi:hypothetical protein B0H13DRAFT_1910281 [Mycena leptocephala]|nr:hypothetical protein B0H13DRAFT_1910281 [Mycena leptocephala]
MKDNRFYSGNYARENERFYICFTQTKSYDITTRKTRPNFTAGKMIKRKKSVKNGIVLLNFLQGRFTHADGTDHQYFWKRYRHVHANVYVPFVQEFCFPVDPLAVILVLAQVLSSVIVITVLEHYFILSRQRARDEAARLNAALDPVWPPIRVADRYGEIERFMGDNIYYIDLENRALFPTVANQRWLAVRLDAFGSLLVFLVAVFAAVGLNGGNPTEIVLILTYTTTLTQMFAVSTRLSAEVEIHRRYEGLEATRDGLRVNAVARLTSQPVAGEFFGPKRGSEL